MTSRSYALILIAGAVALFLGLAAVNVVLDPWWVFRVSPLRHANTNGNDRYDFYRIYAAEPDRYAGLLLTSSRGLMFPLEDLSQHSDGERYARFSVSFGRLADHLAVLDFVLRDKAGRHERLKDAFLLIDLDTFGEKPPPDELQLLQPPAISRDPAFRFWWKNLTAVQLPAWKRALQDFGAAGAASDRLPSAPLRAALAAPRLAGLPPGFGTALARPLAVAPSNTRSAGRQLMRDALAPSGERISARPYFEEDMRIWSRIVSLCRGNGVRLATALSPLAPETYAVLDAADAEAVAERISRIAPVWDFSSPREPSNTPDMWWGPRHYHREVALYMLARMYGGELPPDWRNFGRRREASSEVAR